MSESWAELTPRFDDQGRRLSRDERLHESTRRVSTMFEASLQQSLAMLNDLPLTAAQRAKAERQLADCITAEGLRVMGVVEEMLDAPAPDEATDSGE